MNAFPGIRASTRTSEIGEDTSWESKSDEFVCSLAPIIPERTVVSENESCDEMRCKIHRRCTRVAFLNFKRGAECKLKRKYPRIRWSKASRSKFKIQNHESPSGTRLLPSIFDSVRSHFEFSASLEKSPRSRRFSRNHHRTCLPNIGISPIIASCLEPPHPLYVYCAMEKRAKSRTCCTMGKGWCY